MSTPPVRKRPRHLMDPDNLPRPTRRDPSRMSLDQVQKWVLSVLAASTVLHMAGGVAIAAMYVEDGRTDAQIGLNVLAAVFGVLTVAVFRGIHQWKPVSPWLLLGLLPGIIGAWLTFG